ncbi:hypothetical protein CLD20_02310 [Afifella sp. IM 167]|nr:hypothetical protein [Afifella sp. IM 167]
MGFEGPHLRMGAARRAAAESHAGETNVLPFPACQSFGPLTDHAPKFSPAEAEEMERIRWFVLKSLLSSQTDIERACFLLAGEEDVSLERFAIAFFRALASKARRPLTFYRPGAAAFSEDEIWLARLICAWRDGDEAGARALIAWRVRPEGHRWLRFLSRGLALALPLQGLEDADAKR